MESSKTDEIRNPSSAENAGEPRHVPAEHHVRTERGLQPPGVVAILQHRHVEDVCPQCRQAWEALSTDDRRRLLAALADLPPAASEPPLGPPVAAHLPALSPDVAEEERRVERQRRIRKQAMLDLWRLRRLPPERREERILRANKRFRTRALAELLLEASRDAVRTDPAEAESLASLVPVVLRETPGALDRPWARALALRGHAHQANAIRVSGDLPEAERRFRALRARAAALPPLDPATAAELASLEASLRLGQRRHAEAEELLDRALLLFRHAGDEVGVGKVGVKRGMLLRAEGRLAAAVDELRDAMLRLDPLEHSQLHLSAVNSALGCLCDLERFTEAERFLADRLDDYEASESPYAGAFVRAHQGRIALGMGRHAEAVEQLAASRDGFLELGRTYDAALATLDLACAHLAAGDRAALRRLAASLIPAFRSRAVSRETLAALGLVARAISEDRFTAAAAAELRRRLHAARPHGG